MATTTATTPSGDLDGGGDTTQGGQGSHPFRTMPHNLEAEKGLLGAIFINNRAYETVSDFLRPEHFAYAQHGRIFEAAAKLIERGQIADPVTMRRFFEADENMTDIGGPAYLAELAASAVTVINAGEYGRQVYDLYLKRELIGLGEDVVNKAYGGEVEEKATDQIETAEQNLYDLATKGEYEGGFLPFKDAVITAIKSAEAAHTREGGLAGVGTGFTDMDKLLGGVHSSDLVILAGRPAMGKTALATNIAYNAAKDYYESEGREGAVVGFFSLEMSAEQLASRILSEQSNISSDRMRKGELATEEFNRLSAASTTLHQIPIFIDDTPALTVSALRTRARQQAIASGFSVNTLNALVSKGACAKVARAIGVSEHLRLGRQARDDGAAGSDNILGDVMESLLGAQMREAGFDDAKTLVRRLWADAVEGDAGRAKHPKSALQEWAAGNRRRPPEYALVDRSGPDHAARFTVRVSVRNVGEAEAMASSKQEAETAAAKAFMERYG